MQDTPKAPGQCCAHKFRNRGETLPLCGTPYSNTQRHDDDSTMVRLHPEVLERRKQANLSDMPGLFNASLIDVKQQPPERKEAGEKTVFVDDTEKRVALRKYMKFLLRHAWIFFSPWRSVEALMKVFDKLWPMIENGTASKMVEKQFGFIYEELDGMYRCCLY